LVFTDTFTPLAFHEGRVVYNISVSESPTPSVECFPFDLNRETQVVLYLADGKDGLQQIQPQTRPEKGVDGSSSDHSGEPPSTSALDSLEDQIQANRIRYRRAILHQVILCDYDVSPASPLVPASVLLVPTAEKYRITTIKTLMCDITARLLRSMDTFAQEIRTLSTIESPSAPVSKSAAVDASSTHSAASTPGPATQSFFDLTSARNLVLGTSLSRSTTPTGGRSTSRHSVVSPSRHDRFSEARSGRNSREASRDRKSTFSSAVTSPTDRSISRTAARSRIISGALYLQAGLWPEAVKNLSEGTAAARSNNDNVWHARGLEYIITCLLMFGWAEMYFQVSSTSQVSASMVSLTLVSIDSERLLSRIRKGLWHEAVVSKSQLQHH
jgi:trafficking protein particle complex subunit 9